MTNLPASLRDFMKIMGKSGLKRLAGRIVLVQEDWFRMVGTTGKGYLFGLSHKARTSGEDLRRWRRANLNVVVHYDGEPNLDSGVVYRVEPCSSL